MNADRDVNKDGVPPPSLLPCPFCGGEAEHAMGKRGDGSDWPYVECLDCSACAGPDMWNRRAFTAAKAEGA